MLENIDKNINSSFFIEMLRNNWDRTHSVNFLSNLIGELYIHHVINKDGYNFEYYMTQVEKLYFEYRERKISPENFKAQRARLISTVIATKLGIDVNNITPENLSKVKDYFLEEYVSNGYVTHSFPDAYYESIMKNGLIASTESKQDKPLEIQEIQDIFMSKGVVAPMGGYPYYGGSGIYYEHDFTKTFIHAADSPEWFKWFTSSDHTKTYHDNVEVSPYVLRNESACRINVDDLCSNAGLNQSKREKVIEFYQKYYNKFSSPKLNVAMISKKTIGKNIIVDALPQDLDLLRTIEYVLGDGARQYTEHSGNVYFETISPTDLNISIIPNASDYIKETKYHRETKEHLTNYDNNLAILENACKNKDRLTPSMIPKVEEAINQIKNKKASQQIESSELEKTPLIDSQKPSFDKRSEREIQIYNHIKQKNEAINQQKNSRQLNSPKVKILSTSSSQGNNSSSNKGYTNIIILLLIISLICVVLFVVGYMIVRR